MNKTTAILNSAYYRADGRSDSHCTFEVPAKKVPMAHHIAGLTWTATGYGSRIPTEWMVKVNSKWRRVYLRCYSNIGTTYIGKLVKVGERIIVNVKE